MELSPERQADAIHRYARTLTAQQVWHTMRSSPDDLRAAGCTVAVHNDYQLDGKPHTFWLMTATLGVDAQSQPLVRAFKGEGATDEEALDQIRAAFANATDRLHHAPLCAANHYHGKRAPTGPCACGAAEHAARSK